MLNMNNNNWTNQQKMIQQLNQIKLLQQQKEQNGTPNIDYPNVQQTGMMFPNLNVLGDNSDPNNNFMQQLNLMCHLNNRR